MPDVPPSVSTAGPSAPQDGPLTPAPREAALAEIAEEIRACTACRLHRGRTQAVPGEGSPETEVVFVGEGPGQNEDQQGRPFVGAAGGLLEELLALVGWRREDVFITNVVKCRPPGNRDPEPDEIAACAGFLRRQLEVLDPAVIVTLGRFSLGTFMPGARISSVHGTVRPVDPATGARSAVVCAMYHPAAAFRQTALKETLAADMANLPQVLLDARSARAAALAIRPVAEPAADLASARGEPESEAEPGPADDAGAQGFVDAFAAPMSTDTHLTQGGEQTDQMTLF
ncbi:MAG: uracil-DNA glycosylase family protein [Candidatus Limnocylindrales bacterium]